MRQASGAAEARELLQAEGWRECPTWEAVGAGARSPRSIEQGLSEWPHGLQHCASRIRNLYFHERTLLLSLSPSAAQAGVWLTAIPCEPACTLPPQAMLLALRSLPCVPTVVAARMWRRSGCLWRPRLAWVRVAREAVGPDGEVVPQQWLAHTQQHPTCAPTTAAHLRRDASRRGSLLRRNTGFAAVAHRLAPALRSWHGSRVFFFPSVVAEASPLGDANGVLVSESVTAASISTIMSRGSSCICANECVFLLWTLFDKPDRVLFFKRRHRLCGVPGSRARLQWCRQQKHLWALPTMFLFYYFSTCTGWASGGMCCSVLARGLDG